MAQQCAECKRDILTTRWSPSKSKWIGVECGCASQRLQGSVNSPFSDLVLDHVHDEAGRPVRVTSIHQLREAEKRYNFSHVVANQNEANIHTPKQSAAYNVGDAYRRKFGRS